jgi:hypothetical protein
LIYLIALVLIGTVWWLVNEMIPMKRELKVLLNVAVVIAVFLWILFILGIFERGVKIEKYKEF